MEDTGDVRQQFDDLVDELEAIRRHGIRRLDSEDANDFPLTAWLASRYAATVGGAHGLRWQQVESLLEAAKGRLRPGSAVDGEGKRPLPQGMSASEIVTRVELLFGLRDGTREQLSDELMLRVKTKFGDKREDEKALQRRNKSARQYLADAICLVFEEPLPVPAVPRPESVYISRPELEAEFAAHLESGAKLIVFHGFPGMGKTWLARAALESTAGEAVPEILVEAAGIAPKSLAGLLSRYEVDSGGLLPGSEREALARLLGSEQAPAFVLIDNLDSVDDLARLLPPLANVPTTVVVATCRARSEAIPACRFIDVDTMSDTEAESLIQIGLPHLSPNDTAYLASELENYPLAIRFGCRILQHQTVGVEEFCREIKANAKEFASRARTEQGSTLLALLQRLIELVRQRDRLAFELLRFISLVRSKSLIEDRFLRQYAQWTRSPGSATGGFLGLREFSLLLYGDAIGVLSDFGIIDLVVQLPSGEPPVVSYTIHNLARATLRSLFFDVSEEWAWAAADILSFIIGLNEDGDTMERTPDDLGMAILCGLEFLGELIIDAADEPAAEPVLNTYPWLASSLAATLLMGLDSEPFDEMHDEFIYDIPLHWYQWSVSFVRDHKELYPSYIAANYDRLMEVAARFEIHPADKA
jgi:hypothetical protein